MYDYLRNYFIQVQCQLFCSNKTYCDFVVWTEKDIHIERIYPNEEFWLINVEKVKHIFITSILPELMGKFHSRTSSVQSGVEPQEPDQSVTSFSLNKDTSVNTGNDELLTYCYCKGPEEGEMVGCDNSECVYRWFHLKCLKLNSLPKSKFWYCPDCRKHPEFQRKRKKKMIS